MLVIRQRVEYGRNYEAFTPRNIMQPFNNALRLYTKFPWNTAEGKK